MSKQQIGVVGMAVMGRNLALNIESRGYTVSIFNRSREKTEEVIAENPGKKLVPYYTVKEFVESLETPRRILLMVKAGAGTDAAIDSLKPYLDKGDIIIDGGNTFFQDTIRRNRELSAEGFNFIGTGVSGGEEGALKGPSIMPGGQKEAYELVAPILTKIAAVAEDGEPCVTYIGADGAGHYVKMVHNGIEYGIMQIISEVYDVLRTVGHYSNDEMSEIFKNWDKGALQAYLIEITAKVLKQKDDLTNDHIIDHILNEASYKGTGNWMLEDAIRLGAPITVIAEAVLARFMSKATLRDDPEPKIDPEKAPKDLVDQLAKALYLAMAVSYGQGFEQLTMAAKAYNWRLHYSTIAQNWEAGCIIRSQMLHDIKFAYNADKDLPNLFKAPFFDKVKKENISALREVVKAAADAGVPTPTLSAALNYLESIFNPRLPQNIIQGQRDYFGAHTYQRNDRPGTFHTEWYEEK